jgi:hypothetical protein
VRSANPVLNASLRQDLGTLVGNLDRAGYRAETWTPNSASIPSISSGELLRNDTSASEDNSRGSYQSFSGQQHSGQEGRNPRRNPRPQWLEELEKSR